MSAGPRTPGVPSYYSIIPAPIRYDKSLPLGARMLYGELTSLSNSDGYCWATNGYFAELYDVDKRTVSRWVSALVDSGYVDVVISRNEAGEIVDRRIYICDPNPTIPQQFQRVAQNVDPIDKNVYTPIDKNVVYNSKANIRTKLDDSSIDPSVSDKSSTKRSIPELSSSKKLDVVVDEVLEEWRKRYRPKAKFDQKRQRRIRARLKEGFTREDLLLVLDGVANSPYHLGDNPSNTVYTGVETIYRDAGQVEKFIDLAKIKRVSRERVVPITKNEPCVYCLPDRKCQIHRSKTIEQ